MPVHCYGTPCDVDAIRTIAHEHGLRVIYDAAHAFAVEGQGGSVLNHGDLSVLSFHATKVFNTFEGGAIISQDAAMKQRIDSLKNFGIQNEVTVTDAGINGKMAEVNAAFGLLQLKTVREAIATRKAIAELYQVELADVPGIRYVQESVSAKLNYGYFPILVGTEYPLSRDALYDRLKASNVYPRRYFYPLLSDLPMYCHLPSASRSNLPTAAVAAERILCLPIFPTLDHASVTTIAGLIRATRSGARAGADYVCPGSRNLGKSFLLLSILISIGKHTSLGAARAPRRCGLKSPGSRCSSSAPEYRRQRWAGRMTRPWPTTSAVECQPGTGATHD